jgi:orotidine-5'-phosphate decarboxylase
MKFIDYLSQTALRNNSALCAGFDPVIETVPLCFKKLGGKELGNVDATTTVLTEFYRFAIEILSGSIACIKPNIAFFEQYGIAGLVALKNILAISREHKIPSILDAKRGDIGTTAKAYADAYFKTSDFEADSVTVNPFLGFDTVKVFLDGAVENNKGIFILVKTSNPGSDDLQDLLVNELSISDRVAKWVADNSKYLSGDSAEAKNLSGLGAVVGATHPAHLLKLRTLMPQSLLLIPGYGAQGGTAEDVLPAFIKPQLGAVINASRGLMNNFKSSDASIEILKEELKNTANNLSLPLNKK